MTIHMKKKNLQTNYPKGIDELRVASEPITSLEMLLFRACHMSILPSPDVLIKGILDNGTDSKMHVYNLERKSSLKTKEKDEIVTPTESKTKNTELDKLKEIENIPPKIIKMPKKITINFRSLMFIS